METEKCEFFSKSSKLTKLNSVRTPSFRMPRNEIALSKLNSTCILTCAEELKLFK